MPDDSSDPEVNLTSRRAGSESSWTVYGATTKAEKNLCDVADLTATRHQTSAADEGRAVALGGTVGCLPAYVDTRRSRRYVRPASGRPSCAQPDQEVSATLTLPSAVDRDGRAEHVRQSVPS